MVRKLYRENVIRMFAGALVFIGVILARFASPWWLLLPGFVGLNLFQSAISGFCPLESILRFFGMKTPLEEHLKKTGQAEIREEN